MIGLNVHHGIVPGAIVVTDIGLALYRSYEYHDIEVTGNMRRNHIGVVLACAFQIYDQTYNECPPRLHALVYVDIHCMGWAACTYFTRVKR